MPHDAYIRIPGDGVASVRSHADGRPVHVVAGKQYCRVEWSGFDPPENWLREITIQLATEALWLVLQKQADAFAFQHWASGEVKRRLSYGVVQERVWEQVDGSPEPWEATAFFSPRALERRTRVLQVLDLPNRDDRVADLKRLWSEQRLAVGASEPAVSASSAGLAVVEHYDLPDAMAE
jgi:hypothetical protein